MKTLFDKVILNHITLKNRLVRSATWEAVAAQDGNIGNTAYEIYEELAKGGVGLIISGFTSVSGDDHYFNGMMRLSDDSLIHEIEAVIQKFVNAAVQAEKAGFDGVQIHAAHFFFLSRFISPRVNHRTDNYGGSTDNRMRILLEIMKGIRTSAPTLHITVKINSSDFAFGGLKPDESLYICKKLAENGIDSIEVSGNGTSVSGIRAHKNEAYFADFAARLAKEVNVPVILVGGLRSRDTMEKLLNNTNIELLSLSRPLLREPDFPEKLKANEDAVSKCISCNRCYSSDCHKCVFRR